MRGRSAAPKAGMTLLELLLVMVILALVVGMGVGMFASLDPARRQALGAVKNVLRTARVTAGARQAPALVRLDADAGTIVAAGVQVVGTWHFEDESLVGAYQIGGAASGTDITDAGHMGSALRLPADTPGAHALFAIDELPSFRFDDGFSLTFALRLDGEAAGNVLTVGESFGLQLTSRGALRAWFAPNLITETGMPVRGGEVIAESAPGVVQVGEWAHVKVEYDRRELAVFVDGLLVADRRDDAPVWPVEQPMLVGDARGRLALTFDSFVVSAITPGEVVALPDSVSFAPDSVTEVRFDAGGNLDRRFHDRPAVIGLVYADGSRVDVRVGTYGTVNG